MGSTYFTGEQDSITSKEALRNPKHTKVAIDHGDFLKSPYLSLLITQHYLTRSRQGRSAVFMAAVPAESPGDARAVAVDECQRKKPEVYEVGKALEWNRNGQAIAVYEISDNQQGKDLFYREISRSQTRRRPVWQVVGSRR